MEACSCGFRRISLAALAFDHVVADVKLSPALDLLIRQPAIADEFACLSQFHRPEPFSLVNLASHVESAGILYVRIGNYSTRIPGRLVEGSYFVTAFLTFSRPTTSFARNFATLSINFTGTGAESGKRIVPLWTV
jgi:hypothetical protein